MSAFIDASVIVAILGREPDGESFARRIATIERPLYVSPLVRFEAMLGLVRKKAPPGSRPSAELIAEMREAVADFLVAIRAEDVVVDPSIGERAIEAAQRFGKVVGHPAKLNVGDCFCYACAASVGAPLLYKGDDFSKTDIPAA